MIHDLPPLREIIQKNGLLAKKSLGQHFLLDGNLTDKVVRQAGALDGIQVIEVGPGPGGLTRSLLAGSAAKVHAIERDARCVQALAPLQEAYADRLTIIEADAMAFDPLQVPAPRAVVANLPYNVGTALLTGWLDLIATHGPDTFVSLTLMFQKEVADRLSAVPRSKEYGRLSVYTQWLCDVHHRFDIPASAFVPPPKVTSTVVTLIPRQAREPADKATLERVLKAAFGQRRKMLRASLKSLGADTEELLTKAGIGPTQRAEEIDVAGFCRLANRFQL